MTTTEWKIGDTFEVEKLKTMKDLPMCLLVSPSAQYSEESLVKSIQAQNFSNYRIVKLPEPTADYYSALKQIMATKCVLNSLVLFVSYPLKPGALTAINLAMQTYRPWVMYTRDSTAIEVVAFYYRIFELLQKNDFKGANAQKLKENDRSAQTLGMLELCANYNVRIEKETLTAESGSRGYLSVEKSEAAKHASTSYAKIMRLSQDMDWKYEEMEKVRKAAPFIVPKPYANMTNSNVMYAMDRQDLWYLPVNHTIQQLEFEEYSEKYQIDKYMDAKEQTRFCVTVLSHNNIQHDRYLKAMKSIVMQEYQNYHIVFIDDMSDDNNMNATI